MRGYESFVTNVRKQVFTEVARLAYEGGDYSRMEEIPYKIVPGEVASHRESIFLERAIAEREVRLAMGLPLRPITELRPLSEGVNESAVAEKYYDPPLINIIQYACNACPTKQVRVSDLCQGCLSRSCQQVCPKDAVTFQHGKSVIDQSKCIKCGKCADACPTMPSSSSSAPAWRPAAWTPSARTSMAAPRSTRTSASPAACAW